MQRKFVHEIAKELGLSSKSFEQDVTVRAKLESNSPKKLRVEEDADFLKEVAAELDQLDPGQEKVLGAGLSTFRRKLIHDEVEKRGWSSGPQGQAIAVRHPLPQEPQSLRSKLSEAEVEQRVRQELQNLRPGESHSFPPDLNSYERRIVHKVAEELGWTHRSEFVEPPAKGKGKEKARASSRENGRAMLVKLLLRMWLQTVAVHAKTCQANQ